MPRMMTTGDKVFNVGNIVLLFLMALTCLLPFLHVFALSFSSGVAADKGIIGILPVDFNLAAYEYVFQHDLFFRTFWNTVKRVLLGVSINLILVILTAYPLSKSNKFLPGRTIFSWFFVLTMLVNGGMVPTYLVVTWTGLRNTIWALILPGAVYAFNITLLLNFFRQIPKDLEESAFMDGAGAWLILGRIYIPLSLPALATLTIFFTVGHWNEWFMGLIYLDSMKDYPLQTYLQGVIVDPNFDTMDINQIELMMRLSRKTFNAAQIVIASIPIMAVYPFLQKYFVKGLTLGSLKG